MKETHMSNEEIKHVELLSLFHYIVGGITAFFSCIPFIHVALGLAMLSGKMFKEGHGAPPPAFIGWLFVIMGGILHRAGLEHGGLHHRCRETVEEAQEQDVLHGRCRARMHVYAFRDCPWGIYAHRIEQRFDQGNVHPAKFSSTDPNCPVPLTIATGGGESGDESRRERC